MRTRLGLIFASVLVLAILVTGSPISAQPKVLVIAIPSEPSHIDPSDSMGVQHDLNYHIYRKLYTFTPEMTPEPDLVASDRVSGDQKTWTLELKRGITFFDGTPVNAAAVKYSIDRMLEPGRKAPMAILFRPIKEARVKGEYTIELETTEPFASLKNNLAHPNAGIISPKADKELGARFGRAPVSAGPYMVEEWVSGDKITLTRFPGYQGSKPYYDKLVFRIVPAAETRLAMVERNEAQVAIRMPPTFVKVANANSDLQLIRLEGTRLFYFWFNLEKPPLNDLRVRRALNLAVDRAAIIKSVALGAASPARSVMEKLISYSCPVGELEFNPDQARKLRREGEPHRARRHQRAERGDGGDVGGADAREHGGDGERGHSGGELIDGDPAHQPALVLVGNGVHVDLRFRRGRSARVGTHRSLGEDLRADGDRRPIDRNATAAGALGGVQRAVGCHQQGVR